MCGRVGYRDWDIARYAFLAQLDERMQTQREQVEIATRAAVRYRGLLILPPAVSMYRRVTCVLLCSAAVVSSALPTLCTVAIVCCLSLLLTPASYPCLLSLLLIPGSCLCAALLRFSLAICLTLRATR